MRLREFLTSTALMSLALTMPQAAPSPDPVADVKASPVIANGANANTNADVPVPSSLVAEDKVLASAYFDTLSILSTSNGCSAFFGGPKASVDIFNQLISRVRKDYTAAAVGMKMSGAVEDVFNAATRKAYRLFDNVALNVNGPFYRKSLSSFEPATRLGSFEANTREARVLIFLHEMGHVVKADDGNVLLPNDGNNPDLSRRNSKKIEDVCGDEINGLGMRKVVINPVKRNNSEERFTPPPHSAAPDL